MLFSVFTTDLDNIQQQQQQHQNTIVQHTHNNHCCNDGDNVHSRSAMKTKLIMKIIANSLYNSKERSCTALAIFGIMCLLSGTK